MQKSDQFVQIGQVLKSNGTDGSLVIRLFDIFFESPRIDGDFSIPFWMYFDGLPVPFFAQLQDDRPGSKVIVRLTDIDSREDADALCGKPLFYKVPEDGASCDTDSSDRLGDMDLRGWSVEAAGADGSSPLFAGTVQGIDAIPGNPLLVVKRPDGVEVLVPLHEDLVTCIDRDKKILGMSLPEGLL